MYLNYNKKFENWKRLIDEVNILLYQFHVYVSVMKITSANFIK
jgi:hypothetical protein